MDDHEQLLDIMQDIHFLYRNLESEDSDPLADVHSFQSFLKQIEEKNLLASILRCVTSAAILMLVMIVFKKRGIWKRRK